MAKPTQVMVANDIQALYKHAQWQNTHKGFQFWERHELITFREESSPIATLAAKRCHPNNAL